MSSVRSKDKQEYNKQEDEQDDITMEVIDEPIPSSEKVLSLQARMLLTLGFNHFTQLEEPATRELTLEEQLEEVTNKLAELEPRLTQVKGSFDCNAYSVLLLMALCIVLAYGASSLGIEAPAFFITLSALTLLGTAYLSCLKYQQCALGNEVDTLQDKKLELESATRSHP